MAEDTRAEHDASPTRRHTEQHTPQIGNDHDQQRSPVDETLYPASLLSDPSLQASYNQPVRSALMRQMQQTYGNHALQRWLADNDHNMAESNGERAVQRWEASRRVRTPLQRTPVTVQREEGQFDTWAECYAAMDPAAQKGHDQFVTLQGEAKAIPIRDNACKDRKSGKYDKAKADGIWSKKAMADDKFAEEFKKKETADVNSVTARIAQIEHLCDETDGTNRPGSVGDGTSEWALLWEAEHGEPFRSPAGHAYKLSDYCKVLNEGLAEIQAKQGAVKDDPTKAQIAAITLRATTRIGKMKAALLIWNARVATYPAMWNADGTSKLAPPGVDPLAKGQLKVGWPKDAVVLVP
jgi:hypothetical protein